MPQEGQRAAAPVEYADYLAWIDRQLDLERAVLGAARSRDLEEYRRANRALAWFVPEIEEKAREAGLRRRSSLAQQLRLWTGLPLHIVRAVRHGRAEERAGRNWRSHRPGPPTG